MGAVCLPLKLYFYYGCAFGRKTDGTKTWRAAIEIVPGVVPEYAMAAERYFGKEQGQAWVKQFALLFSQMAHISIRPEWVDLLDFESRFPSAIEAAMSR
jgi:hypothetical protein